MGLPVVGLGLLSAAAILLLRGGCVGSPSHFLYYYYLEVADPNQTQFQFFIRSCLDDQPIARFDNLTRKMEPLVSWMEDSEEKENFLAPEWVFRRELEKISKLSHLTKGLHIWQTILGCELRDDGSKRRLFRYGYNGKDFISFGNETLTWVADHPQAMEVKEMWEKDPGWSLGNKIYLEKTCIEQLQKYLPHRKEVLERTKPLVGKVIHKMFNDSLEVLTCQAFGFYPKEIQATWMRDGEVCQYETLHRNVTPNSDGTYYLNLSIEIDPKERDHFQCHLEHEGLEEPLVLPQEQKTATNWWIPVVFVLVVLVMLVAATFRRAVIIFLIRWFVRCRRTVCQKIKSSLDDSALELVSSSPTSGRGENESLLESMPQSVVIMEVSHGGCSSQRALEDSGSEKDWKAGGEGIGDQASHGGCSSQRALDDSGSTLRRREGKQRSLRKSKSWTGELDALDKAEATESEESRPWEPQQRSCPSDFLKNKGSKYHF